MPVEVPRLKRLDPVARQSQPLTNVQPANLADSQAKVGAAVSNVAEKAIDVSNQFEDAAADTEATKRVNQFETEWRQRMYGEGGVKYNMGDPTPVYKAFDDEMEKSYKSLTEDENLNPLTKQLVMKRLNAKLGTLELQKATEYGSAQNKYETGVADASVNLTRRSMMDAAGFIKKDSPESFAPFDKAIGEIRDTRLRQGMKNGSVLPSPEGKSFYIDENGVTHRVNMTPYTDYQIKKDISDSIYDAMDNAIKSGQMDTAQALRDKYGGFLDPDRKRQIADDFYKGEIKAQAYAAAESTAGLGPDGIDKKLAGLKPEIRDEAYKIIDDRTRRQEQLRERSSKQNYQALQNIVMKRMNSETPYTSINDLESDPNFINRIGRITDPKQRKAIYDSVVQPKESDDQAVARVQNIFFGNGEKEINEMEPEEFAASLSGLNKADRNRYMRKYEAMRTETGAELVDRYKRTGKALQDQLIDIGYIKRDKFNKISGKNEIKFIEARVEAEEWLDKNAKGPMTPKEINDFARQFAVKKAEGQAFAPAEPEKFVGTKTTPMPDKLKVNQPTTPDGKKIINGKTRAEWNREYLKLGKGPASPEQLNKFIFESDQ